MEKTESKIRDFQSINNPYFESFKTFSPHELFKTRSRVGLAVLENPRVPEFGSNWNNLELQSIDQCCQCVALNSHCPLTVTKYV